MAELVLVELVVGAALPALPALVGFVGLPAFVGKRDASLGMGCGLADADAPIPTRPFSFC